MNTEEKLRLKHNPRKNIGAKAQEWSRHCLFSSPLSKEERRGLFCNVEKLFQTESQDFW